MGSIIILLFIIMVGITLILTFHYILKIENGVSVELIMLYTVQVLFLVSGATFPFGYSIYYYLKNGYWLSISLEYIASKLEKTNALRELVQSDTSRVGVSNINQWYSHTDIGWSFLFTCALVVTWFTLYIYVANRIACNR